MSEEWVPPPYHPIVPAPYIPSVPTNPGSDNFVPPTPSAPDFGPIPLFDPTVADITSAQRLETGGIQVFLKSPATPDFSYKVFGNAKLFVNGKEGILTLDEIVHWIERKKNSYCKMKFRAIFNDDASVREAYFDEVLYD